MTRTDVIVVGAGPAGLALACGLLSQGVAVRVVDKAAGPATTSRANFLHARGSEVLDRLGALGDLPQRSVRAMRITAYLAGKPVMRLRFGDPGMDTAAPPMVISQARVEAALRDRLAGLGGIIEWNTPLVNLRQHDAGVVATLGTGEDARAPWLVGCDGANSATRRLAEIGFPGVKLSERFLLADVGLDWNLDRSGTSGWIHPDGMIGAMPMPDDMWRVIAYDPGLSAEKPTDAEILARLERMLPERTGHDVRVTDTEWLSMFRVHRRLADTYRRGRVLIAGDAAHTHAPFGGQGMLTGLGDVENLAWKLALVIAGRAETALVDTYQAERRPLATEVLRDTSTVTKVNIAQGPVGRFLRDRLIVPLVNLPWVQRSVTYRTSQLWVSYRRGPLAEKRLCAKKPRPGDRVADMACRRVADGAPTRLYAELGGRWVLLTPAGDDALTATAHAHLGEHVVELRCDDTGHAEAMLIRPDGHLAWRGSAEDKMADWLRRALGRGDVR
ncbi:oxygenase [Mycolicibacterium elephantis]|uniref:Oxygenase n=1 Tax=Mycolicibacterium elephantis TaxID=81858 RepID=A0A1X0CZB0_9MYCO|nr:FAD-dependent monooxygenase [Mycolicibacterium elephantis]ORA64840.1 oxygenase [Mycolicibacterium elephantis]